MKIAPRIALVLSLTIPGIGQSHAQDTLRDYVIEECAADLEQYCSQVTPGEGRLLYCVAAHEDKISGQCQYALFEAAVLLSELADAIIYVAESCETEIETLCRDVEMGEGRILACLEQNSAALGETCVTALADTAGE